ncbi:MAG: radical SAM protein [Thermoprotei archaeon]
MAQGCSSNCSFCITKLARPQLWSRPAREIIDTVQRAVKLGAVEIQLCSMDNADYFSPPNIRLPELVDMVVQNVEGNYMVRVGMMNPNGFERFADRLTDTLYQSQVYKFLHVPVQSGSPTIVEDMNRHYDPYKVALRILSFKEKLPETVMATDLMVGYPTEDEEAFERTIKLVESGAFDKIHFFRFTPRPHTPAAKMRQLPEHVKKDRVMRLSQAVRRVQLRKHSEYVGKRASALVTYQIEGLRLEARLSNYLKVVLRYSPRKLGRRVSVEITGCTPEHLTGVILEDK